MKKFLVDGLMALVGLLIEIADRLCPPIAETIPENTEEVLDVIRNQIDLLREFPCPVCDARGVVPIWEETLSEDRAFCDFCRGTGYDLAALLASREWAEE